MDSPSICITSYVFGSYQSYIPYFVYSIGRAYPDYFAKIYVEGDLFPEVSSLMNRIRQGGYSNFEIIRSEGFPDHTQIRHNLKVDLRTFYRYIIPPSELDKFDYVYVGDVDMFILKETPSLLGFHKERVNDSLPISNCVRLLPDGSFSKRLTGLHFFKTAEYYAALGETIDKLRYSSDELTRWFNGLDWDEEGLYKLAASAFDLSSLKQQNCLRPWHGLHLGAASNYKPNEKTEERFFNNAYRTKIECRQEVAEALKAPLLVHIAEKLPHRSFYNFMRFLDLSPKTFKMKKNAWEYYLKSLAKDLLRR